MTLSLPVWEGVSNTGPRPGTKTELELLQLMIINAIVIGNLSFISCILILSPHISWTLWHHPLAPLCSCRHGEPWGPGAGRTRLPDALPSGLPRVPPRDDAAVLEEGARRKAHLRVHPVLLGRLLHSHGATVPTRGQPVDGRGNYCRRCRRLGRGFDEAAEEGFTLPTRPPHLQERFLKEVLSLVWTEN